MVVRLLRFLSFHKGQSVKEREASRKASLLLRKIEKKETSQ